MYGAPGIKEEGGEEGGDEELPLEREHVQGLSGSSKLHSAGSTDTGFATKELSRMMANIKGNI